MVYSCVSIDQTLAVILFMSVRYKDGVKCCIGVRFVVLQRRRHFVIQHYLLKIEEEMVLKSESDKLNFIINSLLCTIYLVWPMMSTYKAEHNEYFYCEFFIHNVLIQISTFFCITKLLCIIILTAISMLIHLV